jgi:hypothetical protein
MLPTTTRVILSSSLLFYVTRKNIYERTGSASAQIIYHCSTSPESIPGIIIYILTTGKVWHGHVMITYTINGEVNHNQYSTHNRGKSRGKCI